MCHPSPSLSVTVSHLIFGFVTASLRLTDIRLRRSSYNLVKHLFSLNHCSFFNYSRMRGSKKVSEHGEDLGEALNDVSESSDSDEDDDDDDDDDDDEDGGDVDDEAKDEDSKKHDVDQVRH